MSRPDPCGAKQRVDRSLPVVGNKVRLAARSRRDQPLYVAAQADLAACPRLLQEEFIGRPLHGEPVRFRSRSFFGIPAYVVSIATHPPDGADVRAALDASADRGRVSGAGASTGIAA